MNACTRCGGAGYETYEDDGRMVRDACYHCGTSGHIDDDTLFHDKLAGVASAIAIANVSAMRKARNSDEEGEDWDFCAAENMMSGHDYFRVKVWEETDSILADMDGLDYETQKVLVAWDEYNDSENSKNLSRATVGAKPQYTISRMSEVAYESPVLSLIESDDIPF